jgi:hypothetical protein
MNLLKRLSLVVSLLSGMFAVSAAPSFGQIQLTISAADSNAPACMQEVNAFKTIASRYPRPASWHYIIVCEESSWTTILKRLGHYDPNYEVYGRTYADSGVTYLRGWKLTHTSSSEPSPDRIVAYEEAQSYLHTADTGRAEMLAQQWIKQAGRRWTGPEDRTPAEVFLTEKAAE